MPRIAAQLSTRRLLRQVCLARLSIGSAMIDILLSPCRYFIIDRHSYRKLPCVSRASGASADISISIQ